MFGGDYKLEDEYYDEGEHMDPSNYDNIQYEYDDQRYIELSEIFQSCILPVTLDVSKTYFSALAACFIFQLINFCPIYTNVKQILSGALGLGLLYYYFENLTLHCVAFLLIYYIVARTLMQYSIPLSFTSVLLLAYLTICEFTFEGANWARIRNIQMLLVMKIMSLIGDYQGKQIEEFPSLVEYFGYMLCVGNCIYGPWIDFKTYLEVFEPKKWTVVYVIEIAKSVLCGYLFFVTSTCLIDWMMQDYLQNASIVMYARAFEFRSSHYFVMYMSSSYGLAAGFQPLKDYTVVTRPNKIEFPHSLVEVVVFWNIPMHNWLKKYVFRPLQAYGNFVAVTGTYFVSSLLHGLNYQLSGVLLSLGIYTYVEYNFRRKLSNRLNACISSKQCKPYCDRHRYTERKLGVCFLNLFFTFLTLYHLSYLGCLLDLRAVGTLNFYESFETWRILGYRSHYIVLATFIISLVL